ARVTPAGARAGVWLASARTGTRPADAPELVADDVEGRARLAVGIDERGVPAVLAVARPVVEVDPPHPRVLRGEAEEVADGLRGAAVAVWEDEPPALGAEAHDAPDLGQPHLPGHGREQPLQPARAEAVDVAVV